MNEYIRRAHPQSSAAAAIGPGEALHAQATQREQIQKVREELHNEAAKLQAEAKKIVARARDAQQQWAALPLKSRIAALKRIRDRFLARARDIAEVVHREQKKPYPEAMLAEVIPTVELFDFWARNVGAYLADEPIALNPLNFPAKKARTRMVARGVVGLISPWNYPVAIPTRTIIPALLTGNAVLHKPSEHTAGCGDIIQEIFAPELPDGLMNTLHGEGLAGEAVCLSGVDALSFTGSVRTGRRVGHMAAEALIPCSLELGGKDAAIVLDDADLERAAYGIAWGAFGNAGQNCAGIERCYVVAGVYDQFLQRLTAATREIPKDDVAGMTTRAQFTLVCEQIDDALHQGATLVEGNERDEAALRVAPTILTDVPPDAPLMRMETFGPVLPVTRVADAGEALALNNAGDYGLTTSIWTRDARRAETLASGCQTGVVTINNHAFSAALGQAPWTGVKQTGPGVTGSKHALHHLVRPQLVLHDNNGRRELWWFPYNPTLSKMIDGVLLGLRGGLVNQVRSLITLAPLLPKRFK